MALPTHGAEVASSNPSTLSLSNSSNLRYLQFNFGEGIAFSWGQDNAIYRGPNQGLVEFANGSTAYLEQLERTNTGKNYIYIPGGSYYDIYVTCDYRVADVGSLVFNGTYSTYVFSNAGDSRVAPDSAHILFNGVPVAGPFILADSKFTFDNVEIPLSEDLTTIGIRFSFDDMKTRTAANTETRTTFRLCISSGDYIEISAIPPAPPVYIPILTEILQAIRNLPSLIAGGLALPDKQEQADQFQEDMSGAVSNMDNIKQEIEEGLEKPPPETIVPDIDIIVDSSDEYHVQYTQILSDLLGNAMITNLLLIVASMMFVSYVLFGKKG